MRPSSRRLNLPHQADRYRCGRRRKLTARPSTRRSNTRTDFPSSAATISTGRSSITSRRTREARRSFSAYAFACPFTVIPTMSVRAWNGDPFGSVVTTRRRAMLRSQSEGAYSSPRASISGRRKNPALRMVELPHSKGDDIGRDQFVGGPSSDRGSPVRSPAATRCRSPRPA